jgi:toxin ParE1/3/4
MKIEWTEPAVLDLESIRDYIAAGSEHYATRFVERIIDAVENLTSFPELGRNVPEATEENIRELIFNDHRIMYRVERERILVLTVVHGARNLDRKKPKPWDVF